MTLEEVIKVLETMPAADRFFDFGRFAAEHGWKCASGATKFCYIIPDADFVIKFCRNNKRHNECEQEARAYQSGKKYGIERVLLETRFVYESPNGTRFFMQPKISESHDRISRKTRQKAIRINKTVRPKMCEKIRNSMYYDDLDRNWLSMVISLYGKRFCRSLEQWSKENRVNDLHNANIGYVKGKPVILDYSGYCNF